LPLSPRELVRSAVLEAPESEELDEAVDLPFDLRARPPLEHRGVRDVLVDRPVREERRVLEHQSNPPSVGRHVGHVPARDAYGTCRRSVESGDAPQQRRLAAAVGSEEDEELSRGD